MTRYTTCIRWYLAAAAAVLLTMPTYAAAQGARLNLDALASLAKGAADVTDVTLDPAMLQMAGAFLSSDASNANIKELVSGLQGVYVKTFEFKQTGAFDAGIVDPIRKQLTAPGWAKMVSTRESDEAVDVYLWRQGGDVPGGLAVLVVEPKEVTVVNIVGQIDLQKLAALGGQMGIPKLPIAR